jgi:tRNA pseudouridine synthase 10
MTVLELARHALDSGPVCDNCLGRLVADRSFGLSNDQRGESLRIAVALEDDEAFEPREAACWVCEDECDRFEWWAQQAVGAVHGHEFETYQVGTKVPPLLEENDRLLREDVGLDPSAGELLKSECNREVGKRFGERTGTTVDFERPDVLILCDLATDEVELQVNSAFVYGRYRKLQRGIPQTEWPCRECNGTGRRQGRPCDGCDGTGYRYDTSVEEETVPPVLEAMNGREGVFHGAGREDVDARMLGTGRPFVIEIKEPRKRSIDPSDLEGRINESADGRAEVEGLRLATHEMVERVKEHDASKTYRMAVEFDEPVEREELDSALATLDGATITQETPQRVSHRRADKARVRDVYAASGQLGDDDAVGEGGVDRQDSGESDADQHGSEDTDVDRQGSGGTDADRQATIRIHGEGGLYVKELVSSDEGRTEPSLAGLLGVGATVTALDVLEVAGEDEPFEREQFFR